MATASLRMDLPGLGLVRGDLRELREKVTDVTPAFRKIDRLMDSMFTRQFASEGRFGGTPWPRLAAATLKERAKPGRGRGGILRDTNDLWAAMTKPSLGNFGIRVIQPHYYERGTSLKYAIAHQEGAKRVARKGKKRGTGRFLPQRQIIPDPLPRSIEGSMERILLDFFDSSGTDAGIEGVT